jgi:hypothetical protein
MWHNTKKHTVWKCVLLPIYKRTSSRTCSTCDKHLVKKTQTTVQRTEEDGGETEWEKTTNEQV